MKGRILIVDDDQSMCEMLGADLRRRNFIPVWHTSADEAFTRLKVEDFDVVLSDLNIKFKHPIDPLFDFIARKTPLLQTEGHVFAHGHVRP